MKDRVIKRIKRSYFFRMLYGRIRKRGYVRIENNGAAYRIKKRVSGNGNRIVIGKDSWIQKLQSIINGNGNEVILEPSVRMGPGCSFLIEGNNCRVVIGKDTHFTRLVHLCVQEDGMSINVGPGCMFANGVIIRTSDSHPIFNMDGQRINPPAPVKIGEKVWMAQQVIVMKGVCVGDGAILGTRTVVTKDVPSHSLVVGVPGRVVKEGVYWTHDHLF